MRVEAYNGEEYAYIAAGTSIFTWYHNAFEMCFGVAWPLRA